MQNYKEESLKRYIYPALFIVLAVLFEILSYSFLGLRDSGGDFIFLPKYFLIDFCVICLIASIMYIVKNRTVMLIIFFLFLSFQIVLGIMNYILYSSFGEIFSFFQVRQAGEAMAAININFIKWSGIIVHLLALIGTIVLVVVISKKCKRTIKVKKNANIAISLAVFIVAQTFGITTILIQRNNFEKVEASETYYIEQSDEYLWENLHFKASALSKFGFYGFYSKNLYNMFADKKLDKDIEAQLITKAQNNIIKENTNAALYNDNLIVIMLESFEWFAIDPFNTPTLWDIWQNKSIAFEGFTARNKTNVSEGIGFFGAFPQGYDMNQLTEKNFSYKYSLPNIFKNANATANYFHTYETTFYDRIHVNKQVGFETVNGIEDCSVENKTKVFGDWILDSEYFLDVADKIVPTDGQRFLSFMTTVSTHGPYENPNPRFKEYYELFDKNLEDYIEYVETLEDIKIPSGDMFGIFRQYKCAAMDTDRLVKNILDDLEKKGLAQNTNIVLYADHNTYYNELSWHVKDLEIDYGDTSAYQIPFMIYSPKLAPKKTTYFCNTYDIFPTIMNLYGLEYCKSTLQGYDALSDEIENSCFISNQNGIFDDNYFSTDLLDAKKINPNASVDDLIAYKLSAMKFYSIANDVDLILRYSLLK